MGPWFEPRSRSQSLCAVIGWTAGRAGNSLWSVTKAQLIDEFRKLAPGDKAALLDEFWTEFAADTEHAPLSAPDREALDKRLAETDQDPRPDRDWNDLRAEFLRKP